MSSAEKLFQRMLASKAGWGQKDFKKLYVGFGFSCRNGKGHDFYSHPQYPNLCATVSRQNELPKGYAQHAIKCIEELTRLLNEKNAGEGK